MILNWKIMILKIGIFAIDVITQGHYDISVDIFTLVYRRHESGRKS